MTKEHAERELGYLHRLMEKSEIAYKGFAVMFFVLGAYAIITSGVISPILLYFIYTKSITGNSFYDLLLNGCIDLAVRVLFAIPALLVIRRCGKAREEENRGVSIWLCRAVFWMFLSCSILLPTAFFFNTGRNEFLGIFSVIAVSSVLYLTGVAAENKGLRVTAYVYLILCIVLLTATGGYVSAIEYAGSVIPVKIALTIAYLRSFFFGFYPGLGLLGLGCFMLRKAKA